MSSPSTADLLAEALVLLRQGAAVEAAARYGAVLESEPENADAYYYLALIACQQGRFADGVASVQKSLAADACRARSYVLLGRALGALDRQEEALKSLERAIALEPELAVAHSHRADILSDLGRHASAVESYDRALALAPEAVEDWFNRGLTLRAVGRAEESLTSFSRAIGGKPDFAKAYLERGNALWELQRFEEALASIDESLAIENGFAEAWHSRGMILSELKRWNEALAAYERALGHKGDFAEAWLGRGNLLRELKRHEEALAAYDRALALKPDLPAAWLGRGNSKIGLNRCDDALIAYDKALALDPGLAQAWLGRGGTLFILKQHRDALAAYDRALRHEPDLAEAWFGRGNVLADRKDFAGALAAYDKAVTLDPNFREAWLGRGGALTELGRHDEALAACDRAMAIKSNFSTSATRLNIKLTMCDWTNFKAERAQLLAAIREHKTDITADKTDAGGVKTSDSASSIIVRLTDDRQILLTTMVDLMRNDFSHLVPFVHAPAPAAGKLRLGYISQDFRHHVTGMNLAGVFEEHDRSQFELFGFSLAPDDGSTTRKRIESSFDHFDDLTGVSDEIAARRIHDLDIDVLVELVPHSQGSRPAILAHRPGRVQVNGWSMGYSAGAPYIDYILGDPWILPLGDQPFFLEKIVHLPHTCFPHDSSQAISPHTPSRPDEGLPEHGFVFCCFNASYKIMPEFFAVWMRLLQAVPGSVLWLARNNDWVVANLRREASTRGVDPDRLVFAQRRPELADHLARHRLADLFLDTLPYNAQSTSMDALWAGLPVLTCAGRSYAGRFAMSQLHNIGLPELIAEDIAAYERLALDLARDPRRLAELRARLENNRLTSPLFDTKRLCRELEAAYEAMMDIWQRGEAPRSFSVEAM